MTLKDKKCTYPISAVENVSTVDNVSAVEKVSFDSEIETIIIVYSLTFSLLIYIMC